MATPEKSRRQLVLEAYVDRLEEIRIDNGFRTDAGLAVYLGFTPRLGEDDPNYAIAIVVADEEPQSQGENVSSLLPIELQAIAKADIDTAWAIVEDVLVDIKRAVELEDRTLGGVLRSRQGMQRGTTRTLEREEGTTTVGVGVTYVQQIVEAWGNP